MLFQRASIRENGVLRQDQNRFAGEQGGTSTQVRSLESDFELT